MTRFKLPAVYRPTTKAAKKRELMEQARRAGWRGKTYHSAKKFERKVERIAKAVAERDRQQQLLDLAVGSGLRR